MQMKIRLPIVTKMMVLAVTVIRGNNGKVKWGKVVAKVRWGKWRRKCNDKDRNVFKNY